MMTMDMFNSSLGQDGPPASLAPPLQALWWSRKGDWHRAHSVVQEHEGEKDNDWVHAHLHRQEGDLANAANWYRDAGRVVPDGPIEDEWTAVATELLARS